MNKFNKTLLNICLALALIFFNKPINSQTDSLITDTLTIVEKYGQLSVNGSRIVNEHGDTVALKGMSFFWSQWIGKYYNYNCVKWLVDDWKCTIVRAAMAVEGGYITQPSTEMNKIKAVIEAAIDLGIYVIIDWHTHYAENNVDAAVEFFTEIATLYGDKPNIIYEIYNEPLQISWTDIIKPYAETVIDSIRAIDPDNIIVVGTPTWSQDVDIAANDPIDDNNVVYALHFYAATHKSWLRSKATNAMNKGVALMVTEYGTCESSGSGILDSAETKAWFEYMDKNMISWCNWSIADKNETAAALLPNASANGGWDISELSPSGIFVRDAIITWHNQGYKPVFKEEPEDPGDTTENVNINSCSINNIKVFPNPVNSANIYFEFYLKSSQNVKVEVYSINGNLLYTICNEYFSAGKHQIEFTTDNELSSGFYMYKITSTDKPITGKFIIV